MTFQLIYQVAVFVFVLVDQCGSLTFNCVTTKPKDQETLSCTCTNPTKNGVEWRKGATVTTSCGGGTDNDCFPPVTGYTSDVSKDEFYLQINPYTYTDCAIYSCKDATTGDEAPLTTSIAEFVGGVPSIKSEPGTGQNGTIEITTACLFKESDIVVNWYTVDGGNDSFIPEGSFKTATSCSDTTKVCSGTNAVTLNIGFTHTQKSSRCGKVKVEVYHSEDPSTKLEWTTTGTYCVGDGPDPDCFDITIRVVCIIIICVVGLGMKIVAIICYIIKKIKEKKTFLILEVAVIVLFIICIGIGISVLTDKDKDHCPWQKKCAQAFEGIAVSLVIIDVIIMVLVYFDKIKPFKKAYKAKEAKEPGENHGMTGTSM